MLAKNKMQNVCCEYFGTTVQNHAPHQADVSP